MYTITGSRTIWAGRVACATRQKNACDKISIASLGNSFDDIIARVGDNVIWTTTMSFGNFIDDIWLGASPIKN